MNWGEYFEGEASDVCEIVFERHTSITGVFHAVLSKKNVTAGFKHSRNATLALEGNISLGSPNSAHHLFRHDGADGACVGCTDDKVVSL